MNPQISPLGIAGVFLLVLAPAVTWGVEPIHEVYVINTKPPSVAVIDAAEWTVVGSVPLAPNPTHAVMGADNRFLYVLHKGIYRPEGLLEPGIAELSVVDIANREVVRTLPLAWNVSGITLSENGRYLLCLRQGRKGNKKAKDEYGSVLIVDTRTNQVAARCPPGGPASPL